MYLSNVQVLLVTEVLTQTPDSRVLVKKMYSVNKSFECEEDPAGIKQNTFYSLSL